MARPKQKALPSTIGENKPRIQRRMTFLSVYNFSLSYRRGKDSTDADFMPLLPFPPTEADSSGSCALSDPDGLGIFLF